MAMMSQHLNGNMMCVIDCETTGENPQKHEIHQICFLLVDNNFEIYKELSPFYMDLKPREPETINPDYINKQKLAHCIVNGMDQDSAADLLEKWFEKIKLNTGKKLCPLSHNWSLVRSFLDKWLGFQRSNLLLHEWGRDVATIGCYANDSASVCAENIRFPKCNLWFLCGRLSVENHNPHDALSDCVAIAECYKKLLKRLF